MNQQTALENDELLSVSEVARIFDVSPMTVRRYIKSGSLEAVELPSSGTGVKPRRKVRRSIVNKFILGEQKVG